MTTATKQAQRTPLDAALRDAIDLTRVALECDGVALGGGERWRKADRACHALIAQYGPALADHVARIAELEAALLALADAAEAQARGDDDATPKHLRCIDSGYMADRIIAARAALAKVAP
jgi:hypothetical protein